MLGMISIFLNLPRLALWPRMWSILEKVSKHCDIVPWHFLKTPCHYLGARYKCLGANCLSGTFLLDRLNSSSWLYCPGFECFMLPDQGGIPLNAWKLEKGVRCLLEKKKLKKKKKQELSFQSLTLSRNFWLSTTWEA